MYAGAERLATLRRYAVGVMTAASNGGPKWVSFHVYPAGDIRVFLLHRFVPRLLDGLEHGVVRRFFFILYAEGGLHLRIRLLPEPATVDSSRLMSGVVDPGPHGTMQLERYSRKDHYFGDTMLSVYAELLNEATSWIALRLLTIPSPARRWFTLVTVLHHMLHSGGDDVTMLTRLAEWERFGRNALQRLPVDAQCLPQFRPSSDLLDRIVTSGASLMADALMRRTVHLLKRVRRLPTGPYVAIHATHLLCNKVGLTISQELQIVRGLAWRLEAVTGRVDERCCPRAGSH